MLNTKPFPHWFFLYTLWRYWNFNFPWSYCLQKRYERYEDVVNFISWNWRFLILRSALTCIKGSCPYDKNSVMVDDFSIACDSVGIRWVDKTLHTQALFFFYYIRSVNHSNFFHIFCFQAKFASECWYLP